MNVDSLNALKLLRGSVPLAVMLGLGAPATAAEAITGAQYEAPVDRYGHFALGRPHEYARVRVTTDAGRTLTLQLPEDEVFEDRLRSGPQSIDLSDCPVSRVQMPERTQSAV